LRSESGWETGKPSTRSLENTLSGHSISIPTGSFHVLAKPNVLIHHEGH